MAYSTATKAEDTWQEIVANFVPQMSSVEDIEFPRLSGNTVIRAMEAWQPRLKRVSAAAVHPREVDLRQAQDSLASLIELKLKAAGGRLKIAGGIKSLLAAKDTMVKLVSQEQNRFPVYGSYTTRIFRRRLFI